MRNILKQKYSLKRVKVREMWIKPDIDRLKMDYNEWRKLEYVEDFIDNLDENDNIMVMLAKVMRFCYEEGKYERVSLWNYDGELDRYMEV
jgi:hypothetical protein